MLSWFQVGHILLSLCTRTLFLLDCLYRSARRRKTLLLLSLLLFVTVFGLLKFVPSRGILHDRIKLKNSPVAEQSSHFLPKQHAGRSSFVIIRKNRRHKDVESPSNLLHKDATAHTKTLTPETTAMAADKPEPGFDVLKVDQLFSSCMDQDDVISMQCYIDAFQELCKLFRLFGTVFGFVTSDVEDKTAILRAYNQEQPQHYSTIQSMVEFEVSNNLTDNKKKASGARTLLRLHRAMEFISAFLVKLKDPGNNSKFSAAVSESYDTTLAKHHPWLIRKAVQMALYMLPSRQDLLKKMGIKDTESNMQQIGDLVLKLNAIFGVIEKLYAKDNLLQLP